MSHLDRTYGSRASIRRVSKPVRMYEVSPVSSSPVPPLSGASAGASRPTQKSTRTARPKPTALDARPPRSFQRPSTLLFASEAVRATAELAGFAAAVPMLRRLPKGDGRPVFVLPGFTASDASTQPMRWLLRTLGYNPFGWNQGVNLGPTPKVIDGMFKRFETIRRQTGQPVTLIGWSLGGLYARAIVERCSDDVRHVITMGSPFRLAIGEQTNAGTLFQMLNSRTRDDNVSALRSDGYRGAPVVPSTSIFTKFDGVVPWRSCLDEPGPISENLEVRGSHTGLGHNPAALLAVCDRLRLEPDEFAPFDPLVLDRTQQLLYSIKPHVM
jgi:pimeloyl-ACP methyl ester carboxylesterase